MSEIKIFDLGFCNDEELTRVICVSKYKDKYIFCFNKKRQGYEIPGGHIESGETWVDAAKREMYEETGATKINLKPIAIYRINTYGILCFCEVLEIGPLPSFSEMNNVIFCNELPTKLTYPDTFKLFFEVVKNQIEV